MANNDNEEEEIYESSTDNRTQSSKRVIRRPRLQRRASSQDEWVTYKEPAMIYEPVYPNMVCDMDCDNIIPEVDRRNYDIGYSTKLRASINLYESPKQFDAIPNESPNNNGVVETSGTKEATGATRAAEIEKKHTDN